MPLRFCGNHTVERNITELMKIARCIVSITSQPVTVHRQRIGGPKTEQSIFQGSLPLTFKVSMTAIVDGKKRTRTKDFISWIDLLLYLVKNYPGLATVKLAYHAEHINDDRPFYFQTYTGGVVV